MVETTTDALCSPAASAALASQGRPFDGPGHGPSVSRPARMSRAARSTSPVTA
jgi:hypothetical protein